MTTQEVTEPLDHGIVDKQVTEDPLVDVEYATAHRRMLGALVDITILSLILMPCSLLLDALMFGHRNFAYLVAEYQKMNPTTDNKIDLISLINYLSAEGYILKYLLCQGITILIIALYAVGFWVKRGATPGKMLTRCVIVDATSGQPIGLRQGIMRYFGYIISTLVACMGFIIMHFTPRNRALHDYIAHTVVIIKRGGAKNGRV